MDSDSELQARRSLSHEEDDIDDRDEAQADIDNEDNDSMLRPQDSLLEDGTGSEYACSPVGPAGALGGVVGIRAHHAGLGGLRVNNDVMDEDDDTKDEQSSIMLALTEQNSPISNISSSHRSRNKRKNFKPRNIIYDQASEQLQLQQTAAASLLPSISKKLHLMPQARDNNGPMDLSVQGTNGNDSMLDDNGIDDLEDEEDASSELPPAPGPMTSAASLSVVRPEVLFGGQKEGLMGNPLAGSALPPGMPPFLAPFLAASAVPSSGGPSMKDAFQEVLKLFGFPPELAEVFAKNAQALQQQQHKDPSSTPVGLTAAAAAAAASAAMSQQQPHQQQQAGGQDQGNYMFNYS